jgi:hypothetical protein
VWRPPTPMKTLAYVRASMDRHTDPAPSEAGSAGADRAKTHVHHVQQRCSSAPPVSNTRRLLLMAGMAGFFEGERDERRYEREPAMHTQVIRCCKLHSVSSAVLAFDDDGADVRCAHSRAIPCRVT